MPGHFSNPHIRTAEGFIWWIPADEEAPGGLKTTPFDIDSLGKFVGGWLEIVRTDLMPELECGCHIVMVVNEEGLVRGLPRNRVATRNYYPFGGGVAGDAFLVGEGPVTVPGDDYGEPDFFGLPAHFNRWYGPGHVLPKS